MYTEIFKIIEGGLKNDAQKVLSYAKLLAENLIKDGDSKTAERILSLLNNKKSNLVFQDQHFVAPIDQESRLTTADIFMPSETKPHLIMSDALMATINNFISIQKRKKEIIKSGAEVHSSLLLYGHPGCGKTTIAKYIAFQLGLPLVITRFDSLISSLLGNTAKNIRKIFEYANSKPCILFIDEFDAIAKARDDQHEMGELKRVINSLLQNIDEFTQGNNILLAATNHHELLDRAVWRRFNNIANVGKPNDEAIRELLEFYFKKNDNDFIGNTKRMEPILNCLNDFSHSDIKTICNNTIAINVINNKRIVQVEDIITQIFLFKSNNNYSETALIKYLFENGISQNSISAILKISGRQVANKLKER